MRFRCCSVLGRDAVRGKTPVRDATQKASVGFVCVTVHVDGDPLICLLGVGFSCVLCCLFALGCI